MVSGVMTVIDITIAASTSDATSEIAITFRWWPSNIGHLTLLWLFKGRYTHEKSSFVKRLYSLHEVDGVLVGTILCNFKGETIMSSVSGKTKTPDGRQVLGMILFSMGLYAIVLGWTIPLALLSWPGALSNDASLGAFLLAAFLLISGSLLLLISLFCLKVHWLLVIGVLLVALLVPYVRGWLFPNGLASWAPNWFLTIGVVVLVLSLILLSRIRGIRAILWRTLLVTGVSAAIVYAVAYVCALVAASGSGPIYGQPPDSPVYKIVSLLVGSLDILIIYFWLTRKGTEPNHFEQ